MRCALVRGWDGIAGTFLDPEDSMEAYKNKQACLHVKIMVVVGSGSNN